MKSKEQIVKMIDNLKESPEEEEWWDEQPERDRFINKGWIEALRWVIKQEGPRLVVTPDLQVKVE
jgi:hypothetical protein